MSRDIGILDGDDLIGGMTVSNGRARWDTGSDVERCIALMRAKPDEVIGYDDCRGDCTGASLLKLAEHAAPPVTDAEWVDALHRYGWLP